MSESRRHQRVKTRLDVALVVSGDDKSGRVLNLSEGGALVEVDDFAEGSVEIRFDLPEAEQCWGHGRVVRSEAPDRVGVEFSETNESLRRAVRHLLRAARGVHRVAAEVDGDGSEADATDPE